MTPQVAGRALVVAGVLFAVFMFFHPANDASGALNPIWVPVHIAWYVAYVAIVVALPALLARWSPGDALSARITRFLVFFGTLLSLSVATWDAFVVPYLAVHAPGIIAQVEQTSTEVPAVAFRILVFGTVAMFAVGYVMLGLRVARAGSPLAGALVAIGAPVFWAGALVFSDGPAGNWVTVAGAVAFGVGSLLLGVALTRERSFSSSDARGRGTA